MKETLQQNQNQHLLIGERSAEGLRERNKYEDTELQMLRHGVIEQLNNETPPVAINLARWEEDVVMMTKLREEFREKPLHIAVFGIATEHGIQSILDFASKNMQAKQTTLVAIDINADILKRVDALKLPNVITLHEDARHVSIPSNAMDLVIRDHVGNCCPPVIDREMDREAVRILRKNGLSITNITTSELLMQSEKRIAVPFSTLLETIGEEGVKQLQTDLFDIEDMKKSGMTNPEAIRGMLLEIEPNNSFAIFGSGETDVQQQVDLIGHGEWFRPISDHIRTWIADGFRVEEIRSKSGFDSHEPKLSCLRHIVLLRNTKGNI